MCESMHASGETMLDESIGWVSLPLLMVYLFSAYAVYLLGH